ncbi:MAG TPA: Cof-type HAD-IIB family hydrolase [Thermoleophilia bacterium]|nr:Cof-type HAD-IIB family hydrolase [Thermoleophilia bacterium]
MATDAVMPPAFRPALLAADLDGTLIDREISWADGLPEALARVRAAGVPTVICTGRMLQSVRRVAARLGVTEGPVVCYQGALVADIGSGEWLRHTPMRADAAAEVVRHVRRMGRQLNAYIDDRLYVEEVTPWARRYAEHVEVGIDAVPDLEAEVLRRPPTKLVVVTSADDLELILPGLQERWAGRLYVVRSQPEYIEFTDVSVSKSGALAWLCERLGVPRERVVTLGDGMNDVDMLTWAGLGVAVAEAARPVRDAAGLVVPRLDMPRFLDELALRAMP